MTSIKVKDESINLTALAERQRIRLRAAAKGVPSGLHIAQRNVNSGFDLAKSLAGAKNLSEMVELQAAYWQKLLGALTSQAEEVRALSTKMAAAMGEPLQEQVKRSVDGLRTAN
jgi:hypothetical protein